jgi:hypothetical protein
VLADAPGQRLDILLAGEEQDAVGGGPPSA